MATNGASPHGGVLSPPSGTSRSGISIPDQASPAGVLPLYTATIFLSALLVFAVQPMFTKMVLPLLGGSPGVWNTAMLFFQTTLLAGYAYTHLTTRLLSLKTQMLLHMAVLALALVALPIGVAAGWTPPAERAPVPWLIGLFAVSVGLPFFAVAANAPMLQRWFAHSNHSAAADPYFLYGASNIGSILALLGYPVIIEPLLKLEAQSWTWTGGYALLVILIGACGLSLWRSGLATPSERRPAAAAPVEGRVAWRQRMHWVALAFAPSSLLLGVTMHVSTDIAAAPFLWVIPLTLYLLTFVFVFARNPALKHAWMVRAQPFFVIFVAIVFWWGAVIWVTFPIHLLAFFVTAMVCHGELARRRPAAGQLTEFYLWMSFGGMLGGVFNALLAPVVFDSVIEYPIALVLACMLRPMLGAGGPMGKWSDLALPALLLAVVAIPVVLLDVRITDMGIVGLVLVHVGLGLFAYSFRLRPLRFGFGIAAVIFAMAITTGSMNVVDRERSFFGVYKVKIAQTGRHRLLVSGTTVHGAQHMDQSRRREPLTYFNREGPIGQVFAALEGARPMERVGIIGLGAGSLACYRRAGESWTFYEIDPVVEQIARDQRYFHFLSDCAPDAEVVLGDARLSLEKTADRSYDLLVLDAFSSDAIPVHLLTRQAIALYRQKLADGGLLVFHVSNRNLELLPVLANLAADAGLVGLAQHYRPRDERLENAYKIASKWVVMARSVEDLAILDGDSRWTPLTPDADAALWTDDFSNILGVFIW